MRSAISLNYSVSSQVNSTSHLPHSPSTSESKLATCTQAQSRSSWSSTNFLRALTSTLIILYTNSRPSSDQKEHASYQQTRTRLSLYCLQKSGPRPSHAISNTQYAISSATSLIHTIHCKKCLLSK